MHKDGSNLEEKKRKKRKQDMHTVSTYHNNFPPPHADKLTLTIANVFGMHFLKAPHVSDKCVRH